MNPYEQWNSISDTELSVQNVENILGPVHDDLWVAAACTERVLDNSAVQQALVQTGLSRTKAAVERCKDANAFAQGTSSEGNSEVANSPLVGYFRSVPADAQLCYFRSVLLQRMDRLNTYLEIEKNAPMGDEQVDEGAVLEAGDNEMEEEWDDPWSEEPVTRLSSSPKVKKALTVPFSLSTFLTDDLLWSACRLATLEWFRALEVLIAKHFLYLWPLRSTILESISESVHPSEWQIVSLKFDPSSNREFESTSEPWRVEIDFSETPATQQTLVESGIEVPTRFVTEPIMVETGFYPAPLTADELTTWYKNRADKIIVSTGMVDLALTLIQYGASQGIPGLDELGEELSLLSRLVYDIPQPAEVSDDWTLARWHMLDPPAVMSAYLSHSTPDSLPRDISRLVLPYLYVLEARAERAGTPDPDLPNRLLHEFVLTSRLELAASVFEASKPTFPITQRVIRNEEDLVRLALACLYGSSSLNEWPTMSRIFECLPAWNYPHDEDNGSDTADAAVVTIGTFVTPTTSRPHITPPELMTYFKPLHIASLSRALDVLDVHLEAGEIFSRWSVPAPLKWFLQSNNDAKEQRAWANRMARRAGGKHDQLNNLEDWEWLLEDMIKLTGKSEAGIRNAFGLLDEDEILRIFLGGLLSTGKFDIARSMLYSRHNQIRLNPRTIEEIVITSSHELYDNASSGNYKIGDMKLAYDCLDVPPSSEQLDREKEFIEATSRISSFNICSRPGIPISPIEIRLTQDRLSLVSRVLSSNNDAYKHTEVILDLCFKLGFRGDSAAEVKTLAMVADTALQAEDFACAYENTKRMVDLVKVLRQSTSFLDINRDRVQEATEVSWIGCFQLGRQPEFDDVKKKLQLLGYALELCPPDKLHDVLLAWRRLEKEDIASREEDLLQKKQLHVGGKSLTNSLHNHHRKHGLTPGNGHSWNHASAVTSTTLNIAASSLRAKLQQFHMPSPPLLSTPDAAALASRTFRSVAATFPFSAGSRSATPSQASQYDDHHDDRHSRYGLGDNRSTHAPTSETGHHRLDDVSAQASKVFSKGMSWLIGADDE